MNDGLHGGHFGDHFRLVSTLFYTDGVGDDDVLRTVVVTTLDQVGRDRHERFLHLVLFARLSALQLHYLLRLPHLGLRVIRLGAGFQFVGQLQTLSLLMGVVGVQEVFVLLDALQIEHF